MGIQKNDMGVYDHGDIRVGDVVVVASSGYALRSGAQWYPYAICVAKEPRLTLVSEEGDMRWSTNLQEMPLKAAGRATQAQMNVAKARYEADRKVEQAQELKAAMASIPVVYRTQWTEHEFGERPDGVSYAVDLEALKAVIKDGESGGSPEQYWRAGTITQAIVTPEFYAEVKKQGVYTTFVRDHEGFLGIFNPRGGL